MNSQAGHQFSDRREINFPNGSRAQVVLSSIGVQAEELASMLGIQEPRAVILIAGGASAMDEDINDDLYPLLMNGIVHPATSLGALIIDGGTQTGMMALIGLGVAQQQQRPPLLGVAPVGTVTYPGKAINKSRRTTQLDPNHSHFVLVDTDKWGGETETMYELAQFLSRGHASVAILINGGDIARKEALYNVRQRRPLIIIEGSGRVADEIAQAMHDTTLSSSDSELAEIVTDGELYLFPLTGPAEKLEQLTLNLLKNT